VIDDITERFKRYFWEPVRMVRELFHVEPLDYQAAFLADLVRNDQVAMRSGHGCGKTAELAWAAIWYFLTRPMSKIPWTAPTFDRQVKNVGFAELSKWFKKIPDIDSIVDMHTTKIVMRGFEEQWFIIGVSAYKSANIEGFHAPYVLYIFDEAKGIRREIFEGAAGAMTQGGKMACGSVPGGPLGYFFDIFNSLSHLWNPPSKIERVRSVRAFRAVCTWWFIFSNFPMPLACKIVT